MASYRKQEKINSGGFGVVYRAERVEDSESVAYKELPRGAGEEEKRTSKSPHREGAAANLIFARKREHACAYSFFSTQTDTHLLAQSEHSQGGAQRSEQYLYGAQRAVKWNVGSR